VQQPASSARGRVLLAAEPAGADNLVRALEREYDVTLGGADELADRVRELRPDVLMLDLGLVDLDAAAVVRLLRTDQALEDTAVLVLAEPALEDRAVAALEAGANDHLLKPFSLQALLARVRYALAVSRTCKDLAAARHTLGRLRDIEQARRDLLNLAAHELRTPLTVVMGYVSMLQEGAFGPVESASSLTWSSARWSWRGSARESPPSCATSSTTR
jgi:DNA-binding response OmpR family regulator